MIRVETVEGRQALRWFKELPFGLLRDEPRWAPPLLAVENRRLDTDLNPFFEAGEGGWFVVWDGTARVGRVLAHLARPGGEGRFGFFDCVHDEGAATALLDAARAWLAERGATTMTGPVGLTPAEEAGVRVAGHEEPAFTGRPWTPPWYADLLVAAGLGPTADRPAWRLPTVEGPAPPAAEAPPGSMLLAGGYADPRLVVGDGAGGVAVAVPDLAPMVRSTGLRRAWRLARSARARDWEGCVVTVLDGDPASLVPALQRAGGRAGYRWVLAPWAPEGAAPPTIVDRVFSGETAARIAAS